VRKRQHTRAIADVGVIDEQHPDRPEYRVRDVSIGGAFVLTAAEWQVGHDRFLTLAAGVVRMSLMVHVLRAEEGGYALEFADLDDEERKGLEGLVLELLRSGAGLDERRRAPRRPVSGVAVWRLATAEQEGRLDDLSLVGARIDTAVAPPVGVHVTIRLPELDMDGSVTGTVSCDGAVTRITEHGFAVEFVKPSARFKEAVTAARRQAVLPRR
jgi:hypothetical protein